MMTAIDHARVRLYDKLESSGTNGRGLSWVNRLSIFLILASILLAILESEPAIAAGRQRYFMWAEIGFGLFFAAEYLARVWVSVENPRYGNSPWGRLRYMCTPAALLDLLAIAPLFLMMAGSEAFMLRLVRMLRVLRLARLGRFSTALAAVTEAVQSRRFELLASIGFALCLLIVTSTLMYLLEADVQPEIFGSIPRAMWWSVITLTTVGYGDSFPVTVVGRILAGVTAITGIGLIAMPTGILAAAFSDALQARRHAAMAPQCEDAGRQGTEEHSS